MANDITRTRTPEERELEQKRTVLRSLEAQLVDKELEFSTLQAQLRAFEKKYVAVVGVKYAELDEVMAQVAELLAANAPNDRDAEHQAGQARSRARQTAEEVGSARPDDVRRQFTPSVDLKKLYRDVAKQIHPDLTTDPKERRRRHTLMAEANRAYEDGDEERLREILRRYAMSPEAVAGEGTGAELVRVLRKISQVEERLTEVGAQISELQDSELGRLRQKCDAAIEEGRDLLAEMAADMEMKIAEVKGQLRRIKHPKADH